jgi:hypothetical protein
MSLHVRHAQSSYALMTLVTFFCTIFFAGMMSTGKPGLVQCTQAVRDAFCGLDGTASVADACGLSLEPRGQVNVKGKGCMHTFWISRSENRVLEGDVFEGDGGDRDSAGPAATGPLGRHVMPLSPTPETVTSLVTAFADDSSKPVPKPAVASVPLMCTPLVQDAFAQPTGLFTAGGQHLPTRRAESAPAGGKKRGLPRRAIFPAPSESRNSSSEDGSLFAPPGLVQSPGTAAGVQLIRDHIELTGVVGLTLMQIAGKRDAAHIGEFAHRRLEHVMSKSPTLGRVASHRSGVTWRDGTPRTAAASAEPDLTRPAISATYGGASARLESFSSRSLLKPGVQAVSAATRSASVEQLSSSGKPPHTDSATLEASPVSPLGQHLATIHERGSSISPTQSLPRDLSSSHTLSPAALSVSGVASPVPPLLLRNSPPKCLPIAGVDLSLVSERVVSLHPLPSGPSTRASFNSNNSTRLAPISVTARIAHPTSALLELRRKASAMWQLRTGDVPHSDDIATDLSPPSALLGASVQSLLQRGKTMAESFMARSTASLTGEGPHAGLEPVASADAAQSKARGVITSGLSGASASSTSTSGVIIASASHSQSSHEEREAAHAVNPTPTCRCCMRSSPSSSFVAAAAEAESAVQADLLRRQVSLLPLGTLSVVTCCGLLGLVAFRVTCRLSRLPCGSELSACCP